MRLMNRQESSSQRDPPSFGLKGYTDNNFVNDSKDWMSVMSYCFFLNSAVVSLNSKKQRTVSISITKAKYIALGHVTKEVVWIQQFINKMELERIKGITLHCNNEMSIALTKNAKSQYYTKHIDMW